MKRSAAASTASSSSVVNPGEALKEVTRGSNLASTEIYDVLRKASKDNLVVSTFSVSTVMAMLQAGAGGETASAIRRVFHFPADTVLNTGYQALLEQMRSDDCILETANKIFPAAGYPLNPQFSSALKNYFGAEPQQLNYARNVDAASKINTFVSESTHKKIQNLVEADNLNGSTKLVIINALYFKGQWKKPFHKNDTEEMEFFTSETRSIKGDRLNMLIVVPKKRMGLSPLEEKLKSFPLDQVITSMESSMVHLSLPKFRLENSIDLVEPLQQLGLGVLFDEEKANLSGIPAGQLNASNKIYVSHVLQKTFIEVNEDGTEAAAATAERVLISSSGRREQDYHRVIVNHPFLYAIYANFVTPVNKGTKSKKLAGAGTTMLFTGRCINPTKSITEG